MRHLALETLASDSQDADRGFFEWGYDRLSRDEGMMRHEILFEPPRVSRRLVCLSQAVMA